MRWVVGLALAACLVLGTARAEPFRPLSQRPKENGGLSAAQLDCHARAREPAPGWDETRIFAPIGRPCEVDRFAIVAGHQGGLRSVYGERDDCQYLEKQENGRDCAAVYGAQIDRVLANLRVYREQQRAAHAPLRILIYAHGGMVSHQNAVRSAEQAAAWMLKDGYFPIFLIWHSDFPTAYGDYLCCVSDGDPLVVAKPFFAIARSLGDLTAGIGRAAENFGEQQVRSTQTFARTGDSEFFLCADPKKPNECPYRRTPGNASARDNVIYPPFPDVVRLNDRNGVSLRRRVAYPLLYPVRGVATIGSDLGARSWDNMVRRTRTAFTGVLPLEKDKQVLPAADNPSTWLRCPEAVTNAPLYGAFGQFFAQLHQELGDADWLDARITFVAHSMGAFVGNETARLFPCLPYERFVYMAGAAPIRDVQQSVFPILLRNPEAQFNNLMLHPLAESRELFRGGLAPQGSLLEWVDSMFEGPRSIDDKTVGKWRNVARGIDAIPAEIVTQTSFRIFPTQTALKNEPECNASLTDTPAARASADLPAGEPRFRRCHPVMHGDFDDYTFWRERYWLGEFAG